MEIRMVAEETGGKDHGLDGGNTWGLLEASKQRGER